MGKRKFKRAKAGGAELGDLKEDKLFAINYWEQVKEFGRKITERIRQRVADSRSQIEGKNDQQ